MTTTNDELYVKSHVSRDLLQSAALFKNEHLTSWEYVSNGLQYVDPGISPVVRVRLDSKKKSITIKDNGRGMTFSDLKNFFVMHGENVDRKRGRTGRGMFGTGKSAAFGIGESLTVTTVREGKRTRVRLTRSEIAAMTDDSNVPVHILEQSLDTDEANGTLIEIEGIHLRKLDKKRVVRFIERHLAHWPRDVTVWVNNQECQYMPPTAIRTETFSPESELKKTLGDCVLTLKVAGSPLPEEDRGISIFSKGVWHETTLAGHEGKEMANFIFGEIDVVALDDDKSPVAPFDMSRSMQLNPANATVQATMGFIGSSVGTLRKALVAEERKRKQSADAKRLEKQANEIANVLNNDFAEFRQRIAKARARAKGGDDAGQNEETGDIPNKGDDFIFGKNEPAEIVTPTGGTGGGSGGSNPEPEPDSPAKTLTPVVQPANDSDQQLGKTVGGEKNRMKPRGGFSIDFRNVGVDANRAKYARDARQIVINLDHPQFKAALGSGTIEDLTFRRLAYEVAFSEYALALALELALRDEYMDVTDPIVDIGETINRVARRAASLYEATE